MPVATAKIYWPTYVANRTVTRLFQLIRDFVTLNGWTLLTDDSGAATPAITVTYNRDTGYTGDNPIVQLISGTSGSNYTITARAYESWNTGTKTGTNLAYSNGLVTYSLTYDSEIWISCAPEFILLSALYQDGAGSGNSMLAGVTCIERLAGDTDSGTFFGAVSSALQYDNAAGTIAGPKLWVPKLWNGSTGINAYYSVYSELGLSTVNSNFLSGGLAFPDENERHVIFKLGAHFQSYGRLKGQLYGLATTTGAGDSIPAELPVGVYLPNATNPEWLLARTSYNAYSFLMQVSSPVTSLA
jgi:hypothetical protein